MWNPFSEDLMNAILYGHGKRTDMEMTPEDFRKKAQQDADIARFSQGGGTFSSLGATHKCRCCCPYCGGSR